MQIETDPRAFFAFDNIIDGYFPLHVSLAQMMTRLGFELAFVEIAHAPIMQIPDLPDDAPVPLSIQTGRAGLIEKAYLRIVKEADNISVSGIADWQWLDGSTIEDALDPRTRLAEPLFLEGYYFGETIESPQRAADCTLFACSGTTFFEEERHALCQESCIIWGPFQTESPDLISAIHAAKSRPKLPCEYLKIGTDD